MKKTGTTQAVSWAARWGTTAVFLLSTGIPTLRAQGAREFFDDTVIQDVYLTLDPVDWATLRKNYLEDTYYSSSFTWKGITQQVSIRSRGRGSRSPEKPNLDVDFNRLDKTQRFLGLSRVVLKANNQEASMLHERLAMKIFRRMGIPAPREAPARLFLNGEFFGLYSAVENVDEDFLERNLGESGGYLYQWKPEHSYHFEYVGNNPFLYSPVLWDPRNHLNQPDPLPIVAMVRAVNQASDAEFVSQVSQYINLKQFMSFAAVDTFVGDIDGFLGEQFGMNNFFMYRFQGSNVSQFIPWDKDLAFLYYDRRILQGVQENVLMRRAMAVPELRGIYLGTLARTAQFVGEADGWLAREVEREYERIRDVARLDPHKQCVLNAGLMIPCGPNDFEQQVDALRIFARQRASYVMTETRNAGYSPGDALPTLTGVGGAAPDTGGSLARGSLASIYGYGLAQDTAQARAYPLPTELAGASVLVDGARAPLMFVSPGQINFQVPWDAPSGEVSITLGAGGLLGIPSTISLGDFSPGVFVAVRAVDQAPVSPAKPVAGGDWVVVYANGLGPVNPGVALGQAAPADPLSRTALSPVVTVGGVPAKVDFSGMTPGFAGLYQINVQIPAGLPAGTANPLVISIGGKAAPAVALATR